MSPYEADGGNLIGKRPSSLTVDELRRLGHKESPGRAIRAKCIDCCGGSLSEVRKCTAVTCALFLFRMGKNPFHGKKATEGQTGVDPEDDDDPRA